MLRVYTLTCNYLNVDTGECLIDDCVEIETGGYTKTGKPTKKINWDKYEGDIAIFNPHREGVDDIYRWTI